MFYTSIPTWEHWNEVEVGCVQLPTLITEQTVNNLEFNQRITQIAKEIPFVWFIISMTQKKFRNKIRRFNNARKKY